MAWEQEKLEQALAAQLLKNSTQKRPVTDLMSWNRNEGRKKSFKINLMISRNTEEKKKIRSAVGI